MTMARQQAFQGFPSRSAAEGWAAREGLDVDLIERMPADDPRQGSYTFTLYATPKPVNRLVVADSLAD